MIDFTFITDWMSNHNEIKRLRRENETLKRHNQMLRNIVSANIQADIESGLPNLISTVAPTTAYECSLIKNNKDKT